MRRTALLPFLVIAAFAVAACGTAATNPPTSGGSVAPAGSEGGGDGGTACATTEAGATAAVSVEIVDFAFSPDPVTAQVGDVIGWTNGDKAQHTASLTDGSCGTENLSQGATGLLVFNAAGTYPYKCNIHAQMTGTIEVTE
jgi:plastocyanin